MPIFHPPLTKKPDGQVLDLVTAVKEGVLDSKLDLNAVIHELDSTIDVPSVFICPISLEPMRDPVTLCTGQTYERSNILKWFSLGRYTCPTTMQELWDDSLTPNRTLHHLISTWFSQKYSAAKKRSQDVQGRASEMLESLKKSKGQARVQTLKEIRHVVTSHASAKVTVVESGGVGLISSLLGPFTSYAVGSEAVAILVCLELDPESARDLIRPAKVSLLVDMLNEGCIETKVNCTTIIEILVRNVGSEAVWSLGLLVGLLRLVKDRRHPNGVVSGLGLLTKMIRSHEPVRNSIVSIGGIPQLIELLPNLNSKCLELALLGLEALSGFQEGATALKDCEKAMPNLVRLLMRVSEGCTKLTISVLWEVCKLAPEEFAAVAVDAGLATKLLLVIQSGCDRVLKQQCAELLKLCSLNYSTTIFISKCKLTRAIQ